MSSITSVKTLVLNADGNVLSTWPISFISSEEAIKAVYRGKTIVLEEWAEVFRSANLEIKIPRVLMLKNYAPVHAKPKFCRRSVFLRDKFCCQYCGVRFPVENLTFDHLVPRSKGGQTTWDNILTCCEEHNSAKQDTMPKHSGKKGAKGGFLRPLKEPKQPTTAELLRAGMEFLEPEVKEDFGSWLYWNVELEK